MNTPLVSNILSDMRIKEIKYIWSPLRKIIRQNFSLNIDKLNTFVILK